MPADTAPVWPAMSIQDANNILAQPGSPLALEEAVIAGVPLKVYSNAPPTLRFILEHSTTSFGDRDYLVFEDERATFQATMRAVEHLATALRDKYDVQKGDRVAIIMRNYPQWAIGFYAALCLGAIATPLNSWWTGDELEYGLEDSGAKVAIVDGQIYDRIAPYWDKLPDLKTVLVTHAERSIDRAGVEILETLIGATNSWGSLPAIGLPEVDLNPDDYATIMYTSGTTGRPKGALASHRAIISNMFNSLTCQMRMFLRRGEALPEPDPNEQRVTLVAIPFFHATGACAVLVPSLFRGDKIVSMYKWDVDKALPIIPEEKITAVGGVSCDCLADSRTSGPGQI